MDDKELTTRFTYHAPLPGQTERYEQLRAEHLALARLICKLTPESREQSLALTALEEANMMANAAIARREQASRSQPEASSDGELLAWPPEEDHP